ncbi:hypothetical protein Nepgr_004281 [Nepenthes gracilis]|uniref:Uncharacterized protein n=1 Tax=Nepenthes gracilis TaxID=150966 RepID=A0AAD3XEZ2_NEPGR|nr:hypothetical protein Nepgr_004281 [Nepenthes gracilis]
MRAGKKDSTNDDMDMDGNDEDDACYNLMDDTDTNYEVCSAYYLMDGNGGYYEDDYNEEEINSYNSAQFDISFEGTTDNGSTEREEADSDLITDFVNFFDLLDSTLVWRQS